MQHTVQVSVILTHILHLFIHVVKTAADYIKFIDAVKTLVTAGSCATVNRAVRLLGKTPN